MTDLQALFDVETTDRLADIASEPAYAELMGYELVIEASPFGETGTTEVRIDLGDADISTGYRNRVVNVATDDLFLYAEADHRGPSHGVDAWLDTERREPPEPTCAVASLWLDGVDE